MDVDYIDYGYDKDDVDADMMDIKVTAQIVCCMSFCVCMFVYFHTVPVMSFAFCCVSHILSSFSEFHNSIYIVFKTETTY